MARASPWRFAAVYFGDGYMSENRNLRDIDPFLLSRSEAARFLGVGLNTLALLNIPKTQIRRRVLYRKDILEKWAKDNTGGKK
jgi:hypothetical protein